MSDDNLIDPDLADDSNKELTNSFEDQDGEAVGGAFFN